jgi:HD-GYP domain-containing protein (c-di-GMP phosphodiesterase class II)
MYAHKARQKQRQLVRALLDGRLDRIEAADKVVGSLCNMLYKKAPHYPDHARRVTHLALLVARRIGLPDEEYGALTLAALLHDVGKVSLPTEILRKTGPLTPGETQAMRHHPVLGEEFFEGIDHLEPLRPLIRAHHERFDGAMHGDNPGYPDGLSGERIPLCSRILKLAERVDALLNADDIGNPRSIEQVVEAIRADAGKALDPRLTRMLLADPDWHCRLGDPDRIAQLLRDDLD